MWSSLSLASQLKNSINGLALLSWSFFTHKRSGLCRTKFKKKTKKPQLTFKKTHLRIDWRWINRREEIMYPCFKHKYVHNTEHLWMCVCVCVCVREREKERQQVSRYLTLVVVVVVILHSRNTPSKVKHLKLYISERSYFLSINLTSGNDLESVDY